MTRDLATIGWILLASGLALLLGALARAARVIAIRRPGGAVECCLRQDGDTRWRRGFAAYRADRLCWFRARSVRLRPDAAFDRRLLRPVARPAPLQAGPDQPGQPDQPGRPGQPDRPGATPGMAPGTAVVQFDTGRPGETLWMAMNADALTGLLAWLEAAPARPFPGLA